jgi:serine/threonine protein kinase
VHGDLRPHNILLARNGHAWVKDFGYARPAGPVVAAAPFTSPEQAAGRAPDERSDVYGLGATLYDLVTGHAPFQATTVPEVLALVAKGDPEPPRKLVPDLHPDLETIILHAMDRNPERRYATAGAMAEDLYRHLNHDPILAKRPGFFARLFGG